MNNINPTLKTTATPIPPSILPLTSRTHKYRALAFLRVSTEQQDYQRQKDEIERIAEHYDVEVVAIVEMEGVSGKDTPSDSDVAKLLHDVSAPGIDGLIICELSRLFRPQSPEHFAIGKMFKDAKRTIWTDPDGDGVIEMWTDEGFDKFVTSGSRAGRELRDIKRRSVSGKHKNITREDRKVNGYSPVDSPHVSYGWTFIPHDRMTHTRAHVVLNDAEAAIIHRMAEWALQRIGCHTIAARLNSAAVPTKRAGKIDVKANPKKIDKRTGRSVKERRNTGKWTGRTVRQILTNERLTGVYTRYPGTQWETRCTCPAILSVEVWQTIQLLLPANKKQMTGPKVSKSKVRQYLLTGKGYCKYCGHKLSSKTRPFPRGYYKCSWVTPPPVHPLCTGPLPHIDKDALDTCVFETVWNAYTSGDTLCCMIAAAYVDTPDELAVAEAARIRQLIEDELKPDLEHAHKHTRDRRYDYELAMKEYDEARRALRDAEFRLTQAMAAAAPKSHAKPTDAAIRARAAEFAQAKPETFAEKRAFLECAITAFRTDGKVVEIDCAIPAQSFATVDSLGDSDTLGEQKEAAFVECCEHSIPKRCSPSVRPPLAAPITFSLNGVLR